MARATAVEAADGRRDQAPRGPHQLKVELERVADLRTEKARRALGLPRMRPTQTQWPAFQAVGGALAAAGAQAILYGSAARTRSRCLCVFEEPAPWLQPSDNGTVGVDPDMVREFFLQDCDETTTEQELGRLTRQSLTPFTQPPRQIAWQQKSATYFVCAEDLATTAHVQRQRVRANTRLVEFNAGHHPISLTPYAFAQSIAAAVDHD